MDIINKIRKASLVGRGGACFPTADKWSAVANALPKSGKKKCYIVCNAAEGEPGVNKDGHILENFPEQVIDGIKLGLNFFKATKAYIYINHKYYKKYKRKLTKAIGQEPIEFFIKPIDSGYIGGEESSILNAIEGKKIEPRLRPPFPTENGLWGAPTLINNVETFYNISLVNAGQYRAKRFYTINGDCLHTDVFCLADDLSIKKILQITNNYPKFPFFVQIGGDMSGEILNSKQLNRPASGSGSITVYSAKKHKSQDLIERWLNFFLNETCGQCTPCREGTYRLVEALNLPEVDWQLIVELLDNLDETAICGLGCAVSIPIRSYINNVLAVDNKNTWPKMKTKEACECFK